MKDIIKAHLDASYWLVQAVTSGASKEAAAKALAESHSTAQALHDAYLGVYVEQSFPEPDVEASSDPPIDVPKKVAKKEK